MSYESEMGEPGLNRHVWQTRWEELDPLLNETPVEALPEAADLLTEMLADLGYEVDEEPAANAPEEDVVGQYRNVRGVADRLRAAKEIDVGDLGLAVGDAREIYGYLIENRRGWGGLAGPEP
jgi:hypothetical protein